MNNMAVTRQSGGGRKAKPAALRLIEGTKASHPAVPADTLVTSPKAYSLAPPIYLEGKALEMWDEEVEQLESLGVLGSMDMRAFAIVCQAWSDWYDSMEEVKAAKKNPGYLHRGMLIPTLNGDWKTNPIFSIHNTNKLTYLRLVQEYGMTPVSRMRVSSLKASDDNEKSKKDKNYFTG